VRVKHFVRKVIHNLSIPQYTCYLILFIELHRQHPKEADPCSYDSWPEAEYRSRHGKQDKRYYCRPQQVYNYIEQDRDPYDPQYYVQHLFLYYKK